MLAIRPEIDLGVPAFRAGDDVVLGLKSGNFAAPHFFATAARVLRGAVVRLHSTHSTALLVLRETDPDNPLPPLTAYSAMRLGKMTLLPYYGLGDPAAGDAVRGLAGERSAVVLANRGPVVAAKDMEAAVDAVEELEEKTHALSCCGVGEPSDAER